MNQVNQTARPTRIAAWDLLKLFAIFLVVYGHCMRGCKLNCVSKE